MKFLTRPVTQLMGQVDRLRSYRVFDRPIFLIAAPRSGSTFLFELLTQFSQTWAWHAEVDAIWWKHFPYERHPEPSDYVGADELSPVRARLLRRDFYRHALWAREENGVSCGLGERAGWRTIRYVDKTIANCFHLEVLEKLFPDALYIHLIRDGRATVSSMMEGWRDAERFVKHQLQPYFPVHSGVPHWAFPAPPGWQQVVHQPLENVCAWSWVQHVETAWKGLESIPPIRKRLIRYETLLADPDPVARDLADFCQLSWHQAVADFLTARPLSRTTVSAPEPEKWRRLHGPAIDSVVPILAPTMGRLGYEVAPARTASGCCSGSMQPS